MGYKFVPEKNYWMAWVSERHPKTRVPKTLRRIQLKSEVEARRVEKQLVIEIRKQFEQSLLPKRVTYGELLSRFHKSMIERDLSKLTIDNYMSCLDLHTKHWSNRAIEDITTEEIRQLIKVKLMNRAVSQQKNILKYIRAAFIYAVESSLLIRNPVPRITFRMGDKIKKVLTFQQAKVFLEKALAYDHEWYPIWFVALYTGMRNGELHNLTWDKVDFENGTILVSSTWNKKDGVKELTKSGQDRVIDIAPVLKEFLWEQKMQKSGCFFVLPRISDWDTGRQAEILRMFLSSIGLPEIRFHDLRASWATMLLSKNIEPAKVMKLGGGKDLKTMMVYLRKAGIDTRGTLRDFSIHDSSPKLGNLLHFHGPSSNGKN